MADRERLPAKKRKRDTGTVFRLQAKGFFLTFPKCDVAKEVVQERLTQKWPDMLEWAIIAQEHHQDGDLHLHMAMVFKTKQHYRDPSCFDFIGNSHGNYQTLKHPMKAIKYCQKEDVAPLIIGTLPENTSKRAVSKVVATMVMDGASVSDVNDVEPGYVLTNLQKLQLYRTWVQNEKRRKTKEKWKEFAYDAGALNLQEIAIMEWINNNIKKPREFKQAQLVLEGPTNYRKTSLVNILSRYLSILWMNTLEDFFQWEDDVYDLVVFDEWQANQHSIQFLNQFLDGQEMWIRIKGTQALKTQKIPVILLTNYSQDMNFPMTKQMEKATFLSRVSWIHLRAPLNIDAMTMTGTSLPVQTGVPLVTQLNGGATRSTDMGSPRSPTYTPVPWPDPVPSPNDLSDIVFNDSDFENSEDDTQL